MKPIIYLILFVILFISGTFAQDNNYQQAGTKKDSSFYNFSPVFPNDPEFLGNTPELHMLSFDGNIWTRTFGSLNNVNDNEFISPAVSKNLLAPLRLQFMDSQKFSIFREILGAAQMTAVGIMAYQHIKKYGFIKQKGK